VRWMNEAPGISRAGFHAWRTRPSSDRSFYDVALVQAIWSSFLASDRIYGSRRMWRDILAAGLDGGRQRVERLMSSLALRARLRRRRPPADMGIRPKTHLSTNALDHDFRADRPNAKWVADFTYAWTAEVWL
jgi:putative transposase